MAEFKKIYRCPLCGNVVELLHIGGGTLSCCGQPMQEQTANTVEASQEKHVPVIERTATGILVKVGSIAHPMEAAHFIQWIEIARAGQKIGRVYLKAGDLPQAEFTIQEADVSVRAYCNLHGLWKA